MKRDLYDPLWAWRNWNEDLMTLVRSAAEELGFHKTWKHSGVAYTEMLHTACRCYMNTYLSKLPVGDPKE